MHRPLVFLRCAVCDLWLPEFPLHMRGFGHGDLLCVTCIAWFAEVLGLDSKAILAEMGITLLPPEEAG